jgi:hypothetical protein
VQSRSATQRSIVEGLARYPGLLKETGGLAMSETPKTDAATEYMDVGSTGALAYVRVYFAEQLERENADLLRALTFWFPDKEDSRASNSPTELARDNELLKRLKD